MKYSLILVSLFLFIISSNSTNAQFYAGAVGGVNFADFSTDDDEVNGRTLWGAGAVVDYYFSDNLALRFEPMYLKKGGTVEQTGQDPNIKVSLGFVELPLLLKYDFGTQEKFYLLAGPSVGILTSSRLDAEFSGIVFEADIMDNTEKIDFGLTFGGGVSFPIEYFTIFLEGRYTMGMTNLQKGGTFEATAGHLTLPGSLEEDDKYKTLGLQILIGTTVAL